MDINMILLGYEETKVLRSKWHLARNKNEMQNKAQCLKLLNFLKKNYQLPKDTIVYPNLLVMSGQQVDELEKLLKGCK